MAVDDWERARQKDYPYSLSIGFDHGEERPQQEAILRSLLAEARLSEGDIIHKFSGDLELEVGFKNFAAFALFRMKALGDSWAPSTTCVIDFPGGPNEYWMRAARAFCDAAQLKPQICESEKQVSFTFEYFHEMASFHLAAENQEIAQMAHALCRLDLLRGNDPKVEAQAVVKTYNTPKP